MTPVYEAIFCVYTVKVIKEISSFVFSLGAILQSYQSLCVNALALLYELKVPRWDFQTGRQLRTSPLYDRLDTQGARWMEKHGFERAKYFVPPGKGKRQSVIIFVCPFIITVSPNHHNYELWKVFWGLKSSLISYIQYKPFWDVLLSSCLLTDLLALDQSKTFYKPDWFDIVGAEVKCCKEAVCVIDMSSFTKFELTVSHFQSWCFFLVWCLICSECLITSFLCLSIS